MRLVQRLNGPCTPFSPVHDKSDLFVHEQYCDRNLLSFNGRINKTADIIVWCFCQGKGQRAS